MIITLTGADFSSLNLGAIIKSLDITSAFTWKTNGLQASTGQIMSDANWLVSDPVDVSNYSTITFMQAQTTNTGTSLGCCFYDSSGTVVSYKTNGGTSYVPVQTTLDVPASAVTFRTMWYSDSNANITASDYTFYCTATPRSASSVANLTAKFIWTPGTCIYSTGVVGSSDTNWLYSDPVDVSGYSALKFMHIQTTNTSTGLGYAFYDASNNYISGANNGGTSYVPVEKTIAVPSGAKYFRCMWINTTNSNYSDANNINKFYCYGIS